jgi:hypothetical protein
MRSAYDNGFPLASVTLIRYSCLPSTSGPQNRKNDVNAAVTDGGGMVVVDSVNGVDGIYGGGYKRGSDSGSNSSGKGGGTSKRGNTAGARSGNARGGRGGSPGANNPRNRRNVQAQERGGTLL